jgi:hypothetical protein
MQLALAHLRRHRPLSSSLSHRLVPGCHGVAAKPTPLPLALRLAVVAGLAVLLAMTAAGSKAGVGGGPSVGSIALRLGFDALEFLAVVAPLGGLALLLVGFSAAQTAAGRRAGVAAAAARRPHLRADLLYRPGRANPHPDPGRLPGDRAGPAELPPRRRAVHHRDPATERGRWVGVASASPQRAHPRGRGRHQYPLLLARSRHASVQSLERYARPGREAVARAWRRPRAGRAAPTASLTNEGATDVRRPGPAQTSGPARTPPSLPGCGRVDAADAAVAEALVRPS